MTRVTEQLPGFVHTYWRRRYTILFYMLLCTLVASPIISTLNLSGTLIESFLAASLLVAILPVSGVRGRPYLLVIVVGMWVARPVTAWLDHRFLSELTLGIWTLIGLIAAGAALRFAMRAREVDAEHLYAALSAYLLAGIYFGLLYWTLERMRPGTFTVTGAFSHTGAIYFSFVTLATLGYGDIVPRGQLFLAVMVARLVSLYSTRGPNRTGG